MYFKFIEINWKRNNQQIAIDNFNSIPDLSEYIDQITDLSFQNKDIKKYMIPIKRLDNKKLNMTMKLLILFYMFHSMLLKSN